MDIDGQDSDYEEPDDDDDDREAPSEQDTDEAGIRGEEEQLEAQSDDSDSTHSQRRPQARDSPSPLHARVLDYAEDPDHVTSLAEDPLEEPHEDDVNDDEDDGGEEDEGGEEEVEEVGEEVEEVHEEDPDETRPEDAPEVEEGNCEAHVGENTTEDVVELAAPDIPTTSRPPSPPHRHESGKEIAPPSPPKTKSSKRKHKDRQSKRHSTRSQEPAITETWMEEKIVGIMSKTLPTMLSGLLQEAMSFARQQTPQPVPQPAPTVEVAVGAAEIERDVAQAEVGVQGMEVDRVDGATHMEAEPTTEDTPDDEEANVSIRAPF